MILKIIIVSVTVLFVSFIIGMLIELILRLEELYMLYKFKFASKRAYIKHKDAINRLNDYKKRMKISDDNLIKNFEIIRDRCKFDDRHVDMLLKYINELEYRGLKYKL